MMLKKSIATLYPLLVLCNIYILLSYAISYYFLTESFVMRIRASQNIPGVPAPIQVTLVELTIYVLVGIAIYIGSQ